MITVDFSDKEYPKGGMEKIKVQKFWTVQIKI